MQRKKMVVKRALQGSNTDSGTAEAKGKTHQQSAVLLTHERYSRIQKGAAVTALLSLYLHFVVCVCVTFPTCLKGL